MSDQKPDEKQQKHPHLSHLEKEEEKAVEDVVEFFEATGDEDTPTSDSDTQPPG